LCIVWEAGAEFIGHEMAIMLPHYFASNGEVSVANATWNYSVFILITPLFPFYFYYCFCARNFLLWDRPAFLVGLLQICPELFKHLVTLSCIYPQTSNLEGIYGFHIFRFATRCKRSGFNPMPFFPKRLDAKS
jgi:hypothetical protein